MVGLIASYSLCNDVPVVLIPWTRSCAQKTYRHLAAGHDGPTERQLIGVSVSVEMDVDGQGAGRLAPDGHLARVSTKGSSIGLHPFDGEPLVVQAKVGILGRNTGRIG